MEEEDRTTKQAGKIDEAIGPDAGRMAAVHAFAFSSGWTAEELAATLRGRGAYAVVNPIELRLGARSWF